MPRYQVSPGMSHTMAAPSPPHTPVTTSPAGHRKPNESPLHQRVPNPFSFSRPFSSDNIPRHSQFPNPNSAGLNTPLFRSNAYRPGELSPSSSDMSSGLDDIDEDDEEDDEDADAEDDDNDDDEEYMDSDSDDANSSIFGDRPQASSSGFSAHRPNVPREPPQPRQPGHLRGFESPMPTTSDDEGIPADEYDIEITDAPKPYVRLPRYPAHCAIVMEDLIVDDSNRYAGIEVLHPDEIEDADTEREGQRRPHRSRIGTQGQPKPRAPSPIDHTVMNGLQDLTCRTPSDDEEEAAEAPVFDDDFSSDLEDSEFYAHLIYQREVKRNRRMTSGSIGKRTISESIGSDTDNEDLHHFLDATEAGSSARRLRRRVENRHSLQFTDPPRIDELDEPDTTEDELIQEGDDTEKLARELPYYTLEVISMDVEVSEQTPKKSSAGAS